LNRFSGSFLSVEVARERNPIQLLRNVQNYNNFIEICFLFNYPFIFPEVMSYKITELHPGCNLIYKQIQSPVAHVAIFSESGSRHEKHFPEGIAHFLEHMVFKGTHKRKTFHILAGLENSGCDVNAFTSKEELVLHASFLEEHGARIIGLLAEMLFESSLQVSEIEKERNVILDEIASLQDSPADLLNEQFERIFFNRHPLHREILGTKTSLKKINRDVLLDYYLNIFLRSRKVIVYYGNKSHIKILKLFQTIFEKYSAGDNGKIVNYRYRKAETVVFDRTVSMNIHQTHVMIGGPAYDLAHPQKNALGLLINMLGGQAFNSRLNMIVREKMGLTYTIEAYYNIFADNGYFSVYFSTENGNADKILNIIRKELKKLCEQKTGTLQLHIAKKQMTGQTAIMLDSVGNDMLSAGKVFLYTGRIPQFEEIRNKIEMITAEDLLHVANEILCPEKLSVLKYEPKG
jgi:predicted Zn-dependent peptidase